MLTGLLYKLSKKLKAYSRYRTVKSELSRLSDKDLADIGISRCDIETIARDKFVRA